MKFAVIVHPVLTEFPHVFVQSTNSYVHCAVSAFGVAVISSSPIFTVPVVGNVIFVPYATVTQLLLTVHEFVLFDTTLTV